MQDQLRAQRLLVVQRRYPARRSLCGGSRCATSLLPRPQRVARSRSMQISYGQTELHLSEVSDEIARQLPPRPARRRRIHDDGDPRVGEELGRVRERPVDDLARRVRLGPVVEKCRANFGEVEDPHGYGARGQRFRGAQASVVLPLPGSPVIQMAQAGGTAGSHASKAAPARAPARRCGARRASGASRPVSIVSSGLRSGLVRSVDAGDQGARLPGARVDPRGALPVVRRRSRSRHTSSGQTS